MQESADNPREVKVEVDEAACRLPALAMETAGESDSSRDARWRSLLGPVEPGSPRVRHAPPPRSMGADVTTDTTLAQQGGWLPYLSVDGARTVRVLSSYDSMESERNNRQGDEKVGSVKEEEGDTGSFGDGEDVVDDQEESEELRQREEETARCFQELQMYLQRATRCSTQTQLRTAVLVLFHAIYDTAASGLDGSRVLKDGETAKCNRPTQDNQEREDSSQATEGVTFEDGARAFFSLFACAQRHLATLRHRQRMMESQLKLEAAVATELGDCHEQLQRDLEALQQQQLASHARITSAMTSTTQLEQEYAQLVVLERGARNECDLLSQQEARLCNQLHDLEAQAAYLEFISSAPLKRHLDAKKAYDEEQVLLATVDIEEKRNRELEIELAALDTQLSSLEQQRTQEMERSAVIQQKLAITQETRDARLRAYEEARECHTPRPDWDAIIAQTPELSHAQRNDWTLYGSNNSGTLTQPLRKRYLSAGDDDMHWGEQDKKKCSDDEWDGEGDDEEDEQGQSCALVCEMLQWIERLQKHCSVNLHLSQIWHDVEEARVELNILNRQLDRALGRTITGSGRKSVSVQARVKASSKALAKPEYIVALGVHEQIPQFLRHQGRVRFHALKKSDVEAFIRHTWAEKRKRERHNPRHRVPLEDVVFEKLQRKYGFQPLVAQWGYNLLLALQMYDWDAELELFLLCLTHAISDLVFVDQEDMLVHCRALLVQLSTSYTRELPELGEPRVLLKDALVTLRQFFPLKTALQLQAIERAIIRDMHTKKRSGNDSVLFIDDIFPTDTAYPRGFCVKAMRTQHFREIQDYYALLISELEEQDEKCTGQLPLGAVREAMLALDPLANKTHVWDSLVRGMGVKSRTQLVLHDIVDYKALVKQMNTTGLLKFALNFDPNADVNWRRQTYRELSPRRASWRMSTLSNHSPTRLQPLQDEDLEKVEGGT